LENNHTEWLKQLFEKEEWSEEDRRRLLEYLDNTDDDALRRLMEDRFNEDVVQRAAASDVIRTSENSAGPGVPAGAEDRLLALIHEKITPTPIPKKTSVLTLAGWRKWAAAAAILLVIAGKFILDRRTGSPLPPTSATQQPAAIAAGDRPPGRQNAMLTLSNGTTITLDSAANGNLAQQGNTRVIKLNGQIAYMDNGGSADKGGAAGGAAGGTSNNDAPLLNTISTARGNQYMLVLSDGSKVWLNAASSMRFPTSFSGKERRVEITGEAYFEIADNPSKPFMVVAGGGEIQVLGTHFNVNAYSDESSVKTTLLEGAIAVRKEQSRLVLSPGQQARFAPGAASGQGGGNGRSAAGDQAAKGKITVLKGIDTGLETAWKDGFFWFDNTDIHTLMRQVSRWYDVEVIFNGDITNDGFTGKVSRNVPLSQFLKVLELNEIHFKVEGKKITVFP
jgi:ferric-dicitrate binding protein FerR (iron transport regulator)